MEAYATQISVFDDEGTLIGKLIHDANDLWLFDNRATRDLVNNKPNFITADEYRFIADVIGNELCSMVVRDNKEEEK